MADRPAHPDSSFWRALTLSIGRWTAARLRERVPLQWCWEEELSLHSFPAPSSKPLCQNWLRHRRGTLYLRAAVGDAVSALRRNIWVLIKLWKQHKAVSRFGRVWPSRGTSVRIRFSSSFSSKLVVCGLTARSCDLGSVPHN